MKLYAAHGSGERKRFAPTSFQITIDATATEINAIKMALRIAGKTKKQGRGHHRKLEMRRMKETAPVLHAAIEKAMQDVYEEHEKDPEWPVCECGLTMPLSLESKGENKDENDGLPEISVPDGWYEEKATQGWACCIGRGTCQVDGTSRIVEGQRIFRKKDDTWSIVHAECYAERVRHTG